MNAVNPKVKAVGITGFVLTLALAGASLIGVDTQSVCGDAASTADLAKSTGLTTILLTLAGYAKSA